MAWLTSVWDRSEALKPASEVLSSRDQFKQRIETFIKGKGEVRTTEEGLRKQIEELDLQTLKDLSTGRIAEADQDQAKYKDDRKGGAKKVGSQVQNFVKVFSDFLGVYSGIVSLVKAAGGPYGELAYESLSILFIVSC